jgi:hypothetical protein
VKAKYLISLCRDPGTFFAVGNGFLFAQDGLLSAVVVLGAFAFTAARKIVGREGKNDVRALEITGGACLFAALLATVKNSVCGLVCGLCFGYYNLLLANRRIRGRPCTQAAPSRFSEHCTTLVQRPIVLMSIGMIYSGLSGGSPSLWILPLAVCAPIFALFFPDAGASRPPTLLAIAGLWYVVTSLVGAHFLSAAANACFSVALVLIARRES